MLQCLRSAVVASLALTLPLAGPASAVVWNVNPGGTGDAPTIQAAFDAASPGDLVLLAPGTYTDSHTRVIQSHSVPRTTTAVAFVSAGVSIASVGGAEVTIIDGQGDHHCLVGTDLGSVSVSGITFLNGARAGGEIWGGGMVTHRSSVSVDHCVFEDCESHNGGALFLSAGTNCSVSYTKFLRNDSTDNAGALQIFQHVGVATVFNNTFVDNVANRLGGACLFNTGTTVLLQRNVFAGNVAGSDGGAISCLAATLTSSCNLFWNNSAPLDETVDGCSVFLGVNGDLEADPLFCDPANGNYEINVGSPAAPNTGSDCPLRGACDIGCGAVSIESSTWGSIKASYR